MKAIQRIILSKSFLALFILFVIYGCQTTNSAINTEAPASNLKSDKTYNEVEKVEYIENNSSTARKENRPI